VCHYCLDARAHRDCVRAATTRPAPEHLGRLHRDVADDSGGPEHQNGFAVSDAGVMGQRQPRGKT
jgi:hypothetical protein